MSPEPKKLVKFKLNGQDVEAPEGQLVIDAAKGAGVEQVGIVTEGMQKAAGAGN